MNRRSPESLSFEELETQGLKSPCTNPKDLLGKKDILASLPFEASAPNLFLTQSIKEEMRQCNSSAVLSEDLQEDLLARISPEFKKRFPKRHLGVSTLKQAWEKRSALCTQLKDSDEALTKEGKLNISFLIKENLRRVQSLPSTCNQHPHHFAHQLAMKMGECIAVYDGVRPKLEELTKTIWSLQRHLMPHLCEQHESFPSDENKPIDRLIVKLQLETLAKYPETSQAELAFHIEKRVKEIEAVTTKYAPSHIEKMLKALYADTCHHPSLRMEKTLEMVPYSVAKCMKRELSSILLTSPLAPSESIIQETLQFFKSSTCVIATTGPEELERKIHNWTIQGDLILRFIQLSHSSALYQEVYASWKKQKPEDVTNFITKVSKDFLEKYPQLIGYAKEVELRSWIYLKYIWYNQSFTRKSPSYDRLGVLHNPI